VHGVEENSPAAQAGIEAGDVVVALGEAPIDGMDALHRLLTDGPIGTTTATLLRKNAFMRVSITPVETQPPVSAR